MNEKSFNLPKRRILYVTDGLSPWVIGGMQTLARRHVEWLAEAGYSVSVVHGMGEDVEAQGLDMIRVPWPRSTKLNPWKYAIELQRFSRGVSAIIDRVSPDLVYAEGPVLSAYLARPRAARVPTVFHPHGLEVFQDMGSKVLNFRMRTLRGLMRQHAARSDRVLTQGGRLTRILVDRLGVEIERLAYVPNCLPRGFPPVSTALEKAQRRRYLFVGRSERRKGLHLLLDAFARLAPGATLDVVGSPGAGEPRRGNVTFHGTVRDKYTLVGLFDSCDFLVVPSFSEGMATVILEAFGRALPVIATDVGATRELVWPGKTGWLVTPGDREGLAEALRAAGDLDESGYAAMSRAARLLVTEEFSSERVTARFLAVIEALVNDGPDQDQQRS